MSFDRYRRKTFTSEERRTIMQAGLTAHGTTHCKKDYPREINEDWYSLTS